MKKEGQTKLDSLHIVAILLNHPRSREHFSLKIDGRDQTIWNCILEL